MTQAQATPAGHILTADEYDRFVEFEGWLTEYRDTMDRDVLHCWARDVVATGKAILAIRDRLLASTPDTRSADVPVPRAVYERGGWTDGRWGQAYDLVEAALLAAGHTRPCEHPVMHMLEMEGNS